MTMFLSQTLTICKYENNSHFTALDFNRKGLNTQSGNEIEKEVSWLGPKTRKITTFMQCGKVQWSYEANITKKKQTANIKNTL